MGEGLEFTLVGRGAFATSCAQQILDRGFAVRALVSSDEEARAWAVGQGMRSSADMQLLGEVPRSGRSVLLSVSNDRLVPAELLERFALAINFHDAPLPQYSGSHATSWALMAREREYAITWHRMTARADAGEILLQVPVPVAADETAFSLNGKCHQAALASFAQLLEGIVSGSLVGRPQNPARRVFYPRDRRPDRLAVLDFRRPAQDLDALARALSYGDYSNRLALPKLWTGEGFVVVRRIDVKAARSRNAPGTVLRVADDAIDVATATHDVRLRELCGLDGGRPGRAPREGEVLPLDGAALDEEIAAASVCHWRDEEFWIARFRGLNPLVFPTGSRAAGSTRIDVPGRAATRDRMLADVMDWLGSITAMDSFDVGLEDPQDRGALVARVRPFRAGDALETWERHGPYLRETPLRHPRVPLPAGWKHYADWPVVIAFAPSLPATIGAALRITIDASSGTIRLDSGENGPAPESLRAMAAQLQSRGKIRSS